MLFCVEEKTRGEEERRDVRKCYVFYMAEGARRNEMKGTALSE